MTRSATYLPKPHLLVMLVLSLGAAIAGYLLLPGDAERVAMLERDGDNGRALELLERRFAAGDRSQQTLYQLEQLYQHFGNLTKARVMLEQLAERRPRDQVLQRRLVKFYRDTQDGESYLSALSRLVSQRYSETSCRELISQLRLAGKFVREREAIERCRVKGYRVAGDIVRLAELEAVSGDRQKAMALLRNVDDIKGLPNPRERLLLASMLIDSQANDELSKRGGKWVTAAAGSDFPEALMTFLRDRKAHDAAVAIARDVGKPGDALSLSVAEMMLDRDQTGAAKLYLRGWLERSNMEDRKAISRFVELALDAEDPEVALQAARRVGMQNVAEADLVKIAEALGATGRRDEFELVRTALSTDTLVAHPLLSAMVELNKGATENTRTILGGIASEALDTWRLALWARLMRETGRGADADAKLRAMGVGRPSLLRTKALADNQRVASHLQRVERRKVMRLRAAARRSTVRARAARVRRERIEQAKVSRVKSRANQKIETRGQLRQDRISAQSKAVSRPLAQNDEKR